VLLRKSWARGVVEVSLGASGGVAVVSREYVFLFRFGAGRFWARAGFAGV
jgi:hypothetical protein